MRLLPARLREDARLRRAFAAGLLLAALVAAWALTGRAAASSAETVTLKREDLIVTVEAQGDLDAVRSSLIGPIALPNLWQYKIAFMAGESAFVKKGETILSFDTSNLQMELQKRQVDHEVAVKSLEKRKTDLEIELRDLVLQLAEAESRLKRAGLKADRPAELAEALELKIARLDRELAEKEVVALRARLEGARGSAEADIEGFAGRRDRAAERIRELNESIAKMTITAPQEGIIIYEVSREGQKKKVGDTAWMAEKILKLPDLSEMMGRAEVDEADAGRLASGQRAVIRLDALPDTEFTGRLAILGRVVQVQSAENPRRVFRIEISLDRTDSERMRPGMRFIADVEVLRIPDTLVAPLEAVFLRDGGPVVFRRSGGRTVETPVRLGRRNARQVEIIEGASEGDHLSTIDPAAAGAKMARRAGGRPDA